MRKISFIDQQPIYVTDERAEAIKQQLLIGAKVFDIDGNIYAASTITAITKGSAPGQWGMTKDAKRITAPAHERATQESEGYKKFQAAKMKLLGQINAKNMTDVKNPS